MNKIAITGGLGYLGGRLTHALLRAGFNAKPLTRSQVPSSLKGTAIGAAAVVCDYSLSSLFDAFTGCDTVIHLAALNENECMADPYRATEFNVIGTQRIIDVAVKAGVEKFIFLSTAHVYGSPLEGHIDESRLPRPIHPYAITHLAAEDFVFSAGRSGKIHSIILRMSNSFGPPLVPEVNRWTLLCNDLCRQLVEKQRIVLKTSGIQVRDFISLSDAVNAIIHLRSNIMKIESGTVFNLGGKLALSVRDIAENISGIYMEKTGKYISVEAPDPKSGEMAGFLDFDIGRLESTGFALSGDYRKELAELIDFCEAHFGH